MKIEGLGPIERMGDVMVRETRPAEFVDVRDAQGNLVERSQVMPAQYTVVRPGGFPWLWVAAGGVGLFLLARGVRKRRKAKV